MVVEPVGESSFGSPGPLSIVVELVVPAGGQSTDELIVHEVVV